VPPLSERVVRQDRDVDLSDLVASYRGPFHTFRSPDCSASAGRSLPPIFFEKEGRGFS